jgi:hypothetical protein
MSNESNEVARMVALAGLKIEILHERDPDSDCDITVWVNGVEITADVVDIDPGQGYSSEDWEESAAYAVHDDRDRSYAFKCAVSAAFDQASGSNYID